MERREHILLRAKQWIDIAIIIAIIVIICGSE